MSDIMGQEDLRGNVLKWLQRTGIPLEMSTAEAFRRTGFEVRQSATYSDPEEGKG